MPYININEYDFTVTGPNAKSSNIVALPINASDGPSDRWVTVNSYEEFIQMFGDNPNSGNAFGNSWEYAANLLLRGMGVCVRRITHVLDDNGENTNTLLDGVSTAKAIIKVKDVIGNKTSDGTQLSEGIVNIIDSAEHSVLKSSFKGEEIENPSYKYYTYEENNETKRSVYPDAYSLQVDETNRVSGSFADVATTNSEWNYVGEYANPHYKYQKLGDSTPMNYIYEMPQTQDADGKDYVVGDFFINESNNVVKFNPTPIRNKLWISEKTYPDDLATIDTSNLTTNCFVDVIYNKDNSKAINHVWEYSEEGTDVINHKFVNGNKTVTGISEYKEFKTNTELPTNVGVNYFAVVNGKIWLYSGAEWEDTKVDASEILDNNSKYPLNVHVEFKCTKKEINSGIYKHYFNWEDTGVSNYIDEKNPELVYITKLYWENTKNVIGTRPHVILEGADNKINDIVINTSADTVRTSLNVQVNGHKDIEIDKDYTDTRLVSGAFGITNISSEPIKIYSFKITQKSLNGENNTIYDANIESIINNLGRITSNPLLKIYNSVTGEYLSEPIPKLDDSTSEDRWYIELEPNCTIKFNQNVSEGVFNIKVSGLNTFEVKCHTFTSANGSYDITLSSTEKKIAKVIKRYISKNVVEEVIDYDNIPLIDANGNFNLFIAEYKYPGVNGNFLSVTTKTIANQGIYLYISKAGQHLERVELCSFRYRNNDTGRVSLLDPELHKDRIWKVILNKFGIWVSSDTMLDDSKVSAMKNNLVNIDSTYLTFRLNPALFKNINTLLSLDYVYSLYAQSGDDVCKLINGNNPNDEHVIHEVVKCFEPLRDKYRFDIKYITSGSYIDKITYSKNTITNFGVDTSERLIEDSLINIAVDRQDCVALLDVPYDLPLEEVPFYFEHISTSYAAAYDPWGYVTLASGSIKWMPPSFIQLYTHAKSIQNGNKIYLPPAGVRRAQVPEILKTNHDLTSKYISAWQDNSTPQFINPIIWINGFDYTIYGQKTLYNIVNESDRYQSALQDLNVRLTANEIKRLIFKTCVELTFELNNMMTWNEFKSKIEPTLSTMMAEGVLNNYEILMGTETMTAADLNSGHVVGTVRVSIARAATDWDINFELTPNGVTFSE